MNNVILKFGHGGLPHAKGLCEGLLSFATPGEFARSCVLRPRRFRSARLAQEAKGAGGGETATRSPATVGFKKGNNFGPLLSGGEAAIGLHPVTRHHLVRISDEAIERRPIPCQICVLHGT